ncbi:MAG TPA: tRNA uracil 4-sulfurtransferase ThiI [Candidatus Baltobacteraceae bacterium]|nr:tRNA uracil 4-sulfurtransferase ThiI [Candidatus Baltobacteraceae bacterium]
MIFVVHYAELGIKGRNRTVFESRLVSNIREQLKDLGVSKVRRRTGLIRLEADDAVAAEVTRRLLNVAGLATVLPCTRVEPDVGAIIAEAVSRFKDKKGTFRVTARRPDKNFPMTSQELAARVGEAILGVNPDLKVKMKEADHTCWIELTDDGVYVASERLKGIGGLPLGSGGKLVSLISGGIDSPVASWMMLKRGAPIHFVHFHNFPYTDRASIDIVKDLIKVLNRVGIKATISMINLTPVQEEIAAVCNPQFRVIHYRRFMFRIAERIALREKAGGLVTGESLGQVASQTVQNMRTIEAVTKLPVFRPLIGLDKDEITIRARNIGTFELSTRPHSDCCSLFMPDHPSTKALEDVVAEDEKKLDVEKWIETVMKDEERIDIDAVSW